VTPAKPCPAPRPCGSCPYRLDVPSGVWDADEYAKLPAYDLPTAEQPPSAFMCHQQDGRLCAGWVGVHDMEESLGMRLLAAMSSLSRDDLERIWDYSTDVPLFESGLAAAEHGMRDLDDPSPAAVAVIRRLRRKLAR
jgi:hypothetical protein